MKDKPWILVVDDNKDLTDEIASVISETGKYQALKAYSGPEALKIIEEKNKGLFKRDKDKIKLVLLDIRMPEMDGIKTLEKISELDPNLKAIMVTAYDEDDYWDDSVIVLGAIDYIIKPFDNEELIGVVDRFFTGGEELIRTVTLGKYGSRNLRKEIEERKKLLRQVVEAETKSLNATQDVLKQLISDTKKKIEEVEEERKRSFLPPES